MELNKVEKLLARYEDGETSLAEERLLRDYFLQEEVPGHLQSYQLIFRFSATQAEETMNQQHRPVSHSAVNWYAWSSIAAILIVALGVFFFNTSSEQLNKNDLGSMTEAEALQRTKETLNMVSEFMNEGKSDLAYLKEFNNTKNKIIEIDH